MQKSEGVALGYSPVVTSFVPASNSNGTQRSKKTFNILNRHSGATHRSNQPEGYL